MASANEPAHLSPNRFALVLCAALGSTIGIAPFRISDQIHEASPAEALDYALVRLDGGPPSTVTASGDEAN